MLLCALLLCSCGRKPCPECNGTGYTEINDFCPDCDSQGKIYSTCSECGGSGKRYLVARCKACGGDGKTERICPKCKGKGKIDIRIPCPACQEKKLNAFVDGIIVLLFVLTKPFGQDVWLLNLAFWVLTPPAILYFIVHKIRKRRKG